MKEKNANVFKSLLLKYILKPLLFVVDWIRRVVILTYLLGAIFIRILVVLWKLLIANFGLVFRFTLKLVSAIMLIVSILKFLTGY